MADKLAELEEQLQGMSYEGLRLVLEFAKFLVKQQDKEQKAKEG